MKPLHLLDLFSGIGGFSLGLERTGGFETVAFSEIEDYPSRVLAKHWPEVKNYGDIRDLNAARLRADGIRIDAICGGFPCQDISAAGKGAGIEGERSGLWSEFARLIGELRPQVVFVENVSALLSRGLERVLGDLAALGYDAEWHCIPASAVGAPHRRDRVWIIAYPGSQQHEGDCNAIGRAGAAELSETNLSDTVGNTIWQQSGWRHGARGTRPAEPANDGVARPVADTDSDHRHGRCGHVQMGRQRFTEEARSDGYERGNQWTVEPRLGGTVDGFPEWLHRTVELGDPYADASHQRKIQALRDLWNDNVSQALRRTIGGFDRVQQAQVLFAFLRQYQGGSDEARLLVAGEEAPEGFLRGLRIAGELASAPRRSGHHKQQCNQHPDSVRQMPSILARDCAPHWASCGWEDATPRVKRDVPHRVDRLRGLGNAVVPQIPEQLGNAFLQSIGWRTAA